jgi:hypothetical protein
MSSLVAFPKLLSARQAATLAVLLIVALPVGCISLKFGDCDTSLPQEGEVIVQPGQEIDVYYALPYAGVPDLVTYWTGRCEVKEQTATHFRVRNNGSTAHKLAWKATGTAAPHPVPAGPRPNWPPSALPPANDVGPAAGNKQEPPPPPVTIGLPQ